MEWDNLERKWYGGSKISELFSFSVLKYSDGNQDWNSQISCQKSKQGRP